MKNFNYIVVLICALFASCNGRGSGGNTDSTDAKTHIDSSLTGAGEAPPVNMQYCFYHTDGTQAQDTTSVYIMINGTTVTGKMQWLPKEKDGRKGTLTGTLSGNEIKAVWTFSQEGSKDSMKVEFQLRGNALAQKPYKYDAKTGREFTNVNSDFTVIYSMKNCK